MSQLLANPRLAAIPLARQIQWTRFVCLVRNIEPRTRNSGAAKDEKQEQDWQVSREAADFDDFSQSSVQCRRSKQVQPSKWRWFHPHPRTS